MQAAPPSRRQGGVTAGSGGGGSGMFARTPVRAETSVAESDVTEPYTPGAPISLSLLQSPGPPPRSGGGGGGGGQARGWPAAASYGYTRDGGDDVGYELAQPMFDGKVGMSNDSVAGQDEEDDLDDLEEEDDGDVDHQENWSTFKARLDAEVRCLCDQPCPT
jgi:hypothetical protein